ncbi:CPBP family intramembrane glutamic endopeptidase [Enterovibrio norvegicus]|uniref:CPBP family intramembrane glutamic endopeptidase n=1 Tax=Enterovibrio norvegicus TaxID=188144 RepID=UPI0024B0822E|nr:CPBP family intramembrane glutamic endopeptidase [Enterovibrio norvegicus]
MTLQAIAWLWVPLFLAITASFAHQKATSFAMLGFFLVGAFVFERIDLFALLSTLSIFGLAYCLPLQPTSSRWTLQLAVGWGILIVWSVMLFLHLVPGFNNLQVLDNVIAGPNSAPFSLYLNVDKPLAFFALLLAYPMLLGQQAPEAKRKTQLSLVLIALLFLFSLLPIAAYLGALKPELHLPPWWWLFALNNLLLTCVAEEALFRGLIQQSLSRLFDWRIALIIASLLFGIAHFSGGILLVVFATLAGLGYGFIFHVTGRLWCAVLAHFLFNFAHLAFFTYPVVSS